MKFAYTRLVTEDVSSLASFYEKLLGTPPNGNDDYVELHPEGAILAIVSKKAANYMHGTNGPRAQIAQRSSSSKSTTSTLSENASTHS